MRSGWDVDSNVSIAANEIAREVVIEGFESAGLACNDLGVADNRLLFVLINPCRAEFVLVNIHMYSRMLSNPDNVQVTEILKYHIFRRASSMVMKHWTVSFQKYMAGWH